MAENSILARTDSSEKLLARMRAIDARLAGLAAADPKNVEWARVAAQSRFRLADLLLKRGQPAVARQEAVTGVARLRQLYDANKASESLRLALVRALLVSADIADAAGDHAAVRSACLDALQILGPDAAASRDHHVLDMWVRVNLWLGKEDAAGPAAARLKSFGYADRSYLHFLSSQGRAKGKS
jgi:hypothetical protein